MSGLVSSHRSFMPELLRKRGLLTAIAVFLLLLIAVNLLSAAPMGYFDVSYLSSGGAPLALAAVGQTLVILTGGFDLSAGAVISLVNVLLATHLGTTPGSEILWAVVGIGVGALVGAVNGFFVALLRLQPIVVTLAVMFVTEGVTLLVMDKPGGSVPADFAAFFTGSAIPNLLPAPLILIVAVLVIWGLLKQTRFGTALYAIGSDADAARFIGIKVARTTFITYALSGAAYGLAGVMVTAQTSTGDPLVGDPLLLQIFAAVVIGGTVLGGGRGGCVGSVFGAYALMLIVNILLVLNVPAYYGTVVEGLILILAAFSGVANANLPVARWLAAPRLPAWQPRRGGAAPTVRLGMDGPATVVPRVPWLRRHGEVLRYSLPAYLCFLIVLVVTGFMFGGIGPHYLGVLAVLCSFLIVLALGQGAVILTGGLDLSVPWTIGLAGILVAGFAQGSADAAIWTVPLVLLVGAAIGVVNGAGVVLFGLPPIVVTLGMNGILQGVALLYSGGTPSGFAPPALRWIMTGQLFGITPAIWFVLAFIIAASLLLSRTSFGRRIYAVGNNPRVARLSGVNVGRTTIGVYVLSAVCASLVGIMLAGFSGQASLGMGDDYLLPSIAVVVVGGTLITGGRGHYLGMVGGVLLLTALQTLLAGTTTPPAIREILYGAVVLAAVVALRERAPG
ncbi:ABC transporter permease [Acidisoma cellulosilytica]|uniref:ABC transporter permease n=1 Tax=Acidisoma cellulosilyticum TaxID=2802395 RepID=A0A963Z783_9PROT|nr:ABC transporter permease [Acidisoma cellulosilyticum]MCB8883866.1 ABC transporter permease [Acidisoma cellulosilyticum]